MSVRKRDMRSGADEIGADIDEEDIARFRARYNIAPTHQHCV
jgi:hypothetical protein